MRIGVTAKQHEICTCFGPRYLAPMAGRGFGKTEVFKGRSTYLCTRYPKFHYLYISPVSDLGETVFEEMVSDNSFYKHVKTATNHKYPQIDFKNKAWIKFRSLQRPRGLRGKNIHEAFLDEIQEKEYTERVFRRVIDPMVRGQSPVGNHGTIVFSGQFGHDWFKKQIYNFGSPTLDDEVTPNPMYQPNAYRSWRISASEGYIYQTPDGQVDYAQKKQRAIDTGQLHAWNAEMECIPTASEYAAFNTDQIDEVSIRTLHQLGTDQRFPMPNRMEAQPRSGVQYIVVADPGRTVDPTGILIGDSSGNVVFEDVYPLGQDHAISARNAAQLAVKYNNALLICAANEFRKGNSDDDAYVILYKEMADRFHLTFRAVYEGGGEKVRMIDRFTLALQQKLFAIAPQCVKTLTQLKAYEYAEKKKSGGLKKMEFSGPEGTHDDLVSCAYIYVEAAITRQWTADTRGTPYRAY